jgi:hypothetical protein
MSIRKFLGSLVPGFALVLVLLLAFHDVVLAFGRRYGITGNEPIVYAGVILLSYLLGLFNIQISFRLLDLFGSAIDLLFSKVKSAFLRGILGFFSERLHIFNLCTLSQEAQACFPAESSAIEKDEYASPYWAAKMLVLDSSAALAKEAMEIEGDINFYAGMFLPLVLLGITLIQTTLPLGRLTTYSLLPVGVLAVVIAVFFGIRFQHLRHDDIAFVAHAAESIRNGKTSGRKVIVEE